MEKIQSSATLSVKYEIDHIRNGKVIASTVDFNVVPTEGLARILNLIFDAGTSKTTPWYLALGTGNYTVSATDTGANIVGAGRANETSLYSEATRVSLVVPVTATGVATNTASKATFTASAPVTITNAFIVNTSPKGDVAGALISSLKLSVAKVLDTADQLVVTVTYTATST